MPRFISHLRDLVVLVWLWLRGRRPGISEETRAICEQYGEEVIALVVASGHTPRAQELRVIYQTDDNVAQAAAWVDERSRIKLRKERITLALEIVVVLLIGWEIRLGYQQEQLQSRNFDQQQQVLSNLQRSSAATAEVLQNSTQNFQDSASAAKRQIEFLQNERQERDDAVLLTLYKELTFNQGALADNEISLATELAALKESKTLIGPINTLRMDAWELLRLYLPHQISSSAKLLNSVTEVYKSTDKINGVLRSREEYRIHNGSMDNFGRRMQAYDQQLQQLDAEISPRLKELLPVLKDIQKTSSRQ